MSTLILYSFRRCPFAIRARMALTYSELRCELREVLLKDKPTAMLELSQKGTVPVLFEKQHGTSLILDESIEIIHWALAQSDPEGWSNIRKNHSLVERNDGYFKYYLDRYKYSDRYTEQSRAEYFESARAFLEELEVALSDSGAFLCGKTISWVDIAIFPFVRQFAAVDRMQFDHLPMPKLIEWLNYFLESDLFNSVMQKYPVWIAGQPKVYLAVNKEVAIN